MAALRLAIISDYVEEGWPSMDLFAEMLLKHVGPARPGGMEPVRVCPPFRHRFSRLPGLGRWRLATKGDRFLNRFLDFPRYLRRRRSFDYYHICDHSYAHLVHELPAERTGVFCHDLDAFRSVLEPGREVRPLWFRCLMRHVLRGLQKAALVFYTTTAIRRQIEAFGLLDPARLVQAPCGVAAEYTADPGPSDPEPLPGLGPELFLLHVGSCIPRKRIDVLLEVFAALRARQPELRLVQVGGEWTAAQRQQIERLGIGPYIRQARGLERVTIATLYRRSAVVLQPSEAEGFGLPVIEALACGASVVASDLPVLREVGGNAAAYCPVGDVPRWAERVARLLASPATAGERASREAWAQQFRWTTHAATIATSYLRLAEAGPGTSW